MSPLLDTKMTDVSMEGPPKFDPGVYDLECTKVDVDQSNVAKVFVKATFMLANRGPDDARQITNRFFIKDDSMWVLKRFLTSAGSPMANEDKMDTDRMIGLVCKAKIEHKRGVKDGVEQVYTNITQFILPTEATV